jgi:ribosome-binding factor A
VKIRNFDPMSSIRQQKIEAAIRQELSAFLLMKSSEITLGAMVSVTVVRVTADLSLARCYLSVFAHKEPAAVLASIESNTGVIRRDVGNRLKNMRKIPSLRFFLDDSLDYADQIDKLLKK